MSYLDNKTLDIVLEENTDFGFQLQFESVTEECITHPVSGEQTNCEEVKQPLPVDALTFSGSVSDSLGDDAVVLASFTFNMTGAAQGLIEMILPKVKVNQLAANRGNVPEGERKRLIGYYDVISYDSNADITTRIMEGKVYVSDGVTE